MPWVTISGSDGEYQVWQPDYAGQSVGYMPPTAVAASGLDLGPYQEPAMAEGGGMATGSMPTDVAAWKQLAFQAGVNAYDTSPGSEFDNWVAGKKAAGFNIQVSQTPGYKYKYDVTLVQNGQPVGVQQVDIGEGLGTSFTNLLKETAPVWGAALAFNAPAILGATGTGAGAGAAGIAEGMAPGVLAPATAAEMAGVNAALGAGAAGAGSAGMAGTAGTAGTGAAAAGGAGMSAGTGAAAAQAPAFGLGNLLMAGSSLASGLLQSSAAQEAAATQAGAAQAGIEEQRRQFDEIQKLLAPYVSAGQQAIGGFQPYQQAGMQAFEQQQVLAGLRGPEAQQAAISQIESSPFLQSQIEQGERALLQRAGATGGLRGGNLQAALAQFRPQMLQQAIEQQYGRLGGFAGAGLGVTEQLYRGGQASATGQASQAQATGANIANLLQQQGAAQAGGQLSAAAPFANLLNMPMQLAGINYARTGQFGLPSFGGLFGGGSAPTGTAPTGGSGLRGP